ncbi:MAG: type II CAAX endopeptidase family protein [Terracidiphilus sp.]|jgi:membrane protease YdiL (CAAX protease family)
MSSNSPAISRLRAYLRFILAVVWFFVARGLAHREAGLLAPEQWIPLTEQLLLVLLLLLGYATMGFWLDRELHPLRSQGLPARKGWLGEVGLGLAVGWAVAVVCVLPLVVGGGIAIVLNLGASAWGWLAVEVAFFALLALGEEIAFRGYGFQRFVDAMGPLGAALGFAAYYAIVQSFLPGSNRASLAVSVALSLTLSTAYLRTRALWVSWGLNFGWKASRSLLFGLAISGDSGHSPVVQGNPMGPFWLTGGGFGLDGSWVAFVVILIALPVIYRMTRELDFVYNAPVIVPGGIPVDISAAAHSQHEAAMGPAATPAVGLVQILPAAAPEIPSTEKPPAAG